MVDEFALFKSRELANIVRYSEDKHDKSLGLQPSSLDNVTDEFYRSAVEINEKEGTIISSFSFIPYDKNAACKADVPEFNETQ